MAETLFLPYCATSNPDNIGRLVRTIEQQRALDRHLGRSLPYRRTLFTDRIGRLPMDVVQFFDGGLFECSPYVSTPAGSRFSLSIMRNAAIRHARTIAPEWLMFCDSDTIIVPSALPAFSHAFAIPNVYYQESAAETAVDSVERLNASETSLFAKGNSWFILKRELVFGFLMNEAFAGYGWEDNEFEFRISGSGHHVRAVDFTVVHSFHPQSERRIDELAMAANRAMALAMRLLIENGTVDPLLPAPHLEVCDAVHPSWQSKLVFCPSRQQVVHLEHRKLARYERHGESVRIQWPFYKADEFRIIDGRLIALGLLGQPGASEQAA